MLSTIQWVSLGASSIFLAVILYSVRKKRLKEAYSLLWIFTGVLLLVVSVWTNCLQLISRLIGIAYPPATLFLILLGGILLILFQYSLLLSKNQERIMRLTQEIALLRQELEELRAERDKDK